MQKNKSDTSRNVASIPTDDIKITICYSASCFWYTSIMECYCQYPTFPPPLGGSTRTNSLLFNFGDRKGSGVFSKMWPTVKNQVALISTHRKILNSLRNPKIYNTRLIIYHDNSQIFRASDSRNRAASELTTLVFIFSYWSEVFETFLY
jgi:hypothetical protein